jgi:hypothetical protein
MIIMKSKEYKTWCRIKYKCNNPNNRQYKWYGAKGISVCERWENSFAAFLEDMGTAPTPKHSIDRVNNKGNYEPGNCRWATDIEQQRNRGDNRIIQAFGEQKTVSEWVEFSGIPKMTIFSRLGDGWNGQDAVSIKPRKKRPSANPIDIDDKIKALFNRGVKTREISTTLNQNYKSVAARIYKMKKRGVITRRNKTVRLNHKK